MKKLTVIILLIFRLCLQADGQMVTTDPAVPTTGKSVKIYFDSSKDGGELKNYTGDLYVHTGVILEGSSQWQKVIGTWGNNSTQPKCTYLGNYRYELVISPDINGFYNIQPSEKVLKIALVFRNPAGSQQTRPDIFIDVFTAGLNAVFVLPEKPFMVTGLNRKIPVRVAATLADSVSLFINKKYIKKGATPELLTDTITASQYGEFWVKAVAWDLPKSAADSFFFYVRETIVTEALPAGITDGINYTSNTSATLVLHAPYKDYAFAVGDFNGWRPGSSGYMKKTPDGERYWIEINNLITKKEYRFQYLVDSNLYIPDPYAEKVLDPLNDQYITPETYPDLIKYPKDTTTGIVSVLQTGQDQYTWKNSSFRAPPKNKLVIYEMLVRDFVAAHNYKTITDTLDYLQKLGINAIELMPVTEFEGNLSWGYNVSLYFAPDKYYGPKNALKELIDSCHSRGIAVILDMVLNHCFGQSPFVQLYLDYYGSDQIVMKTPNPWFNATSPNQVFKWGADFNHESPATQKLTDRINAFWLTEYKVDGFRFDFTKGFTNTAGDGGTYDAARINILKRMADRIWQVNPNAYVILEHLAPNSEEKILAEHGMLLWGNLNHQYSEAAMGYTSDLTWASSKARGWNVPNLVTYMESHDEERLMYKALNFGSTATGYNVRELETALRRMELAAVFLLTIPGPKMIWQFGELGYDISIDLNGRTGGKPILWIYYSILSRYRLFTVYRVLNELRKTQEVFSTDDYTYSLTGKQKSFQLNSPSLKVNILGNFDIIQGSVIPGFQQTGKWYEYFTDDSINVSSVNDPVTLQPGEYRIYTTKRLSSPKKLLGTDENYLPPGDQMARVYPNPSRENFNFVINTASPSEVRIMIFDISGKAVRQINYLTAGNGEEIVSWDGRNGNGNRVPGGLYFARVTAGNKTETIRLIRK